MPASGSETAKPFVFTRVLDAPRDLVFAAWTERERLMRWWGPQGFTMRVARLDLRPGSVFHYGMRMPNGHDMWGRFVFREIVRPERIVWVNSFSDEKGGVTRHPGAQGWPLEMLNTVSFAERDGKTTLTLESVPLHATASERATFEAGHGSMRGGFGGTFDQLAAYLASNAVPAASTADREIVISREIDAPRELVFDAFTDRANVAKWWGPTGFTTTVLAMDVRAGGRWRYVMHGPDGTDYDNRVAYLEVARPERLVYWLGSDRDDDPARFHVTVTFEERGGKTRLTMRSLFSSKAQRDATIAFGAIEGGKQTLDRLTKHVASRSGPRDRREVLITRDFDAPREAVFSAWTDPEQLKRWYAPSGCTVRFRRIDVREGGTFHSCIDTPDGHECWCTGVYRERGSSTPSRSRTRRGDPSIRPPSGWTPSGRARRSSP